MRSHAKGSTRSGASKAKRLALPAAVLALVLALAVPQASALSDVTTTTASAVTDSEATLNGTVNPDGEAVGECVFEWGLTTSYGNTVPCVPNPAGDRHRHEPGCGLGRYQRSADGDGLPLPP